VNDFYETTQNRRSFARRWLAVAVAGLVIALVAGSAFALGAVPMAKTAFGIEDERKAAAGPAASGEPTEESETMELSEPTAEPSVEESSSTVEGPMNVLILGVDRRPNGDVEGLGTRSDTIMLAHIEPATGSVQIVSVPRDLYVEIAPGESDKINAAYSYDGLEGTISALQNYGDIPIDHYAVVDFNAFRTIVNEMGGLEVDVATDMPEIGLEEGLQTLPGNKALLYARYRGTEGGDLDRIRRQQQVVAALRGKALRWESLTKLPTFASIVADKVETDLGVDETVSLGRAMLQNDEDGTMSATQLTGTPDTLDDGTQVLIPNDEENQRILAPFRY
jgi:polyisoprenyl-teichoic acid--peptidoglycan teichoic acid transferase